MPDWGSDINLIEDLLARLFPTMAETEAKMAARTSIKNILAARAGVKPTSLKTATHDALLSNLDDVPQNVRKAILNPDTKTRSLQRLVANVQGTAEDDLTVHSQALDLFDTLAEKRRVLSSMQRASQRLAGDKDLLHRLISTILTTDPHIPF